MTTRDERDDRRMRDDARRLHEASQDALEQAPLLERWSLDRSEGVCCLIGFVSGHPLIPDGRFVRTSLVRRVAPEAGWALTRNRFYRLGRRFDDRGTLQ